MAEHHRILGDTSDERPSNKLLLCGTGNVPPGCHGEAHYWRQAFGRPRGYIVTRLARADVTLHQPVWYSQPSLARVGWYCLTDDGELHGPLDLPAPPEPVYEQRTR